MQHFPLLIIVVQISVLKITCNMTYKTCSLFIVIIPTSGAIHHSIEEVPSFNQCGSMCFSWDILSTRLPTHTFPEVHTRKQQTFVSTSRIHAAVTDGMKHKMHHTSAPSRTAREVHFNTTSDEHEIEDSGQFVAITVTDISIHKYRYHVSVVEFSMCVYSTPFFRPLQKNLEWSPTSDYFVNIV